MTVAGKMALRMGVYCVLVGLLVCDLFVFQGPVYQSLNKTSVDHERELANAKADGVVAKVYSRPIFRSQIEEAMKEHLWRRGREVGETSPLERKMLRELILQELIDDELIKLQVKVSDKEEVEVSNERVEAAVLDEQARYSDPAVFEALAKRAGWQGENERRLRVTGRIQREDYLKDFVRFEVTETEVRAWYDDHLEDLGRASFEDSRQSIVDALEIQKRDDAWMKFRHDKLRFRSEGKIDLYKDVLFAEE